MAPRTAKNAELEDRLMTVRQLAAHLNLNERTLLKLVSEGALPGVKIGNQWRFRKAMIDAWLDDQMLGVAPLLVEESRFVASRDMFELSACFRAEQILPEIAARTKMAAIGELAGFAARLGLVRDQAWFIGALVQRENVMPSAPGNGVAFLHALHRDPQQVARPFMILGRSRGGIDFDALDGRPTHLFFVLGLKHEELHLPWLAKLSQMLATPDAVRHVLDAPDAQAMYGVLADCERSLTAAKSPRSQVRTP